MATNGYARITAGVKLHSINPNKSTNVGAGYMYLGLGYSGECTYIPVDGYKTANFMTDASNSLGVQIIGVYADGTESATLASLTQNTWSSDIDISSYVCVKVKTNNSGERINFYYSLIP